MKKDVCRKARRTLLDHVELSGKRVLEVGCGEGNTTQSLIECAREVVAIDPDFAALNKAKNNCLKASYVSCEGETLPFGNSSFDVVIFTYSLHHIPVPLMGQALKEASRVTRPKGKMAVLEPVGGGSFVEAWRMLKPYEDQERQAAQEALRKLEGWTVNDDVFFKVIFELESVEEFRQQICGQNEGEITDNLKKFLDDYKKDGEKIMLEAERRMCILSRG